MAHDGTGTGWDFTSPADAEFVKDGANEIRDLRKGVAIRANKEHVAAATSSAGGEHKQGSAKAYYNGSAPTKRPDGTTNLDNTAGSDPGRLWIDGGVLKYWNGSSWVAISTTASLSVATLSDVKSSGTSGGTFSAGSWVTRTLNTEVDANGIVTLSSNQFTLAAGTYEIEATAPAYAANGHQARIWNVTDSTTLALGTSEYSPASTPFGQTSSRVKTIFTISGSKTYRLEHRCEVNAQFGRACASSFGVSEVYAQVIIRKI